MDGVGSFDSHHRADESTMGTALPFEEEPLKGTLDRMKVTRASERRLDDAVKRLRLDTTRSWNKEQIALELEVGLWAVNGALHRLLERGEIAREKGGRKSKQQTDYT